MFDDLSLSPSMVNGVEGLTGSLANGVPRGNPTILAATSGKAHTYGEILSPEAVAKIANEFYSEGVTVLTDSPKRALLAPTVGFHQPDSQLSQLPFSDETLKDLERWINLQTTHGDSQGWRRSHSTELQSVPSLAAPSAFNVQAIRQDFPILNQTVHGKPLIWFDNAATTQKPQSVIDALSHFFEKDNSNVHRGAHILAQRSTDAYEGARTKVQGFLGAASPREIIFARGATEAINLVAQTYGKKHVGTGDEVLVTTFEHHSNIVPWQFLCKEKGAVLRAAPINDNGEILLEEYERLLSSRTKIVAITHVSNALGTVLPIETMIKMAHQHGARVLVDGAQAVAHFPVNVQTLDCDFYVFSGHKLFAPTGIGALYGKLALLEDMPPWQGGGSMINKVTFDSTTFAQIPYKFEAGTGNIGAAVGLGAAIDYLRQIGLEVAAVYEKSLTDYASQALSTIPGLRQIGTAANKVSVLSFILDKIQTEDMGKFLDQEGIAVRAGHHCAQPSLRHFGLASTVRPSLAFYNTHAEVDTLVAAIWKAKRTLSA